MGPFDGERRRRRGCAGKRGANRRWQRRLEPDRRVRPSGFPFLFWAVSVGVARSVFLYVDVVRVSYSDRVVLRVGCVAKSARGRGGVRGTALTGTGNHQACRCTEKLRPPPLADRASHLPPLPPSPLSLFSRYSPPSTPQVNLQKRKKSTRCLRAARPHAPPPALPAAPPAAFLDVAPPPPPTIQPRRPALAEAWLDSRLR